MIFNVLVVFEWSTGLQTVLLTASLDTQLRSTDPSVKKSLLTPFFFYQYLKEPQSVYLTHKHTDLLAHTAAGSGAPHLARPRPSRPSEPEPQYD